MISRLQRFAILGHKTVPQLIKSPPTKLGSSSSLESSVSAVLGWLERSQLANGNGGFAARYNMLTGQWQASYPETSGYLIPTLIGIGEIVSDQSMLRAADSAGNYLLGLQQADGSIDCRRDGPEGTGSKENNVAFDMGAILNGFCSLGTSRPEFLSAAERLADFLCREQSAEGVWPHNSYFPYLGTHNTLTAFSLVKAARLTGRIDFENAAKRTLKHLIPNFGKSGFIAHTSFTDVPHKYSFIHPFCYAIEGLQSLEDYGYDFRANWYPAIERLANLETIFPLLPSHFNDSFQPLTKYSVLTGAAQSSLALMRSGESALRSTGIRILHRLCLTIDTSSPDDGVRGGLQSSWPFSGRYGRFTFNNWSAKYFLDCYLELNYGTSGTDR